MRGGNIASGCKWEKNDTWMGIFSPNVLSSVLMDKARTETV